MFLIHLNHNYYKALTVYDVCLHDHGQAKKKLYFPGKKIHIYGLTRGEFRDLLRGEKGKVTFGINYIRCCGSWGRGLQASFMQRVHTNDYLCQFVEKIRISIFLNITHIVTI